MIAANFMEEAADAKLKQWQIDSRPITSFSREFWDRDTSSMSPTN